MARTAWLRIAAPLALTALPCVACGASDHDAIPPELLAAIKAGEGSSQTYPEGPYGKQQGDVAKDVCIQAWRDPKAAEYEPSQLEKLCFSDYWDPAARDHSLLLVNTSALWCTACRSEYGGTTAWPSLGQQIAKRTDKGLRGFGVLFQDAKRDPASANNAVAWAQTFEVAFPFGFDEPFAMGAFADPVLQPFNMLLDTKTMKIVLTLEGDDPETLWPAIDAQLDR
ncbi:MAG TPA: hypothetical protein VHM70_22315 [Polyangiaceae bacterium]|jgi:hypothetical protein|nr:hypothetical protein [Polyangiaceae bacterium]